MDGTVVAVEQDQMTDEGVTVETDQDVTEAASIVPQPIIYIHPKVELTTSSYDNTEPQPETNWWHCFDWWIFHL